MGQTSLHKAFRSLPDPRVNREKKHNLLDIIALNLLKKDNGKESLRTKRLKAAWNKDFLIKLLKN